MDVTPRCDWDNGPCLSPEKHEGWRHATSFEEIQEGLREGALYDTDGDEVRKIKIIDKGEATITYAGPDGGINDYKVYIGNNGEEDVTDVGYVLVPDPPVTEEEIDETILSILSIYRRATKGEV